MAEIAMVVRPDTGPVEAVLTAISAYAASLDDDSDALLHLADRLDAVIEAGPVEPGQVIKAEDGSVVVMVQPSCALRALLDDIRLTQEGR